MTTHSITLASVILLLLAEVRPEAVSSQAGTPVDLLPAEHRSEAGRSAEPDSLLDSIASLFGGGPKVAQKKAGPRPGPVYRPQARPQHHQQQQSSVHRPVAVAPPSQGPKCATVHGFRTPPAVLGVRVRALRVTDLRAGASG